MDPKINHTNFSWMCHVCLQERPNHKISVAKHRHVYPNGIEMTHHVRFCNDNVICTHLASHHDLTGVALLHSRDAMVDLTAQAEARQVGMLFLGLSLGLFVAIIVALAFPLF